MNIARIALLFQHSNPGSEETKRLHCVLTVCVVAAKLEADAQSKYMKRLVRLDDESATFSIDDIMEYIPTEPDGKKRYKIYQVLDAIEQLKAKGYIDDKNDDFETIQLTDFLFEQIAKKWMESRCIRRFEFGYTGIYTRSQRKADRIYKIRVAIQARGGYKEKGAVYA
ncbi:hypothetical protein [Spirosoma fluminis]